MPYICNICIISSNMITVSINTRLDHCLGSLFVFLVIEFIFFFADTKMSSIK